jgi:histidinol-phosphate phosphatase family protein
MSRRATVFVDSDESAALRSASSSSPQRPSRRPTVFVDRDGTLNVDQVRGVDVATLRLMPHAAEAMRLWRDAGWRIVVVSNQSGIGRGLYTEADMHAFHRALEARLGVAPDAYDWCPHVPDAGCACRKPGTRMYERTAQRLGIDLRESFVVGDSWRDVLAGQRIGARATVLVPSPGRDDAKEAREAVGEPPVPSFVARDLREAARWTLAQG